MVLTLPVAPESSRVLSMGNEQFCPRTWRLVDNSGWGFHGLSLPQTSWVVDALGILDDLEMVFFTGLVSFFYFDPLAGDMWHTCVPRPHHHCTVSAAGSVPIILVWGYGTCHMLAWG